MAMRSVDMSQRLGNTDQSQPMVALLTMYRAGRRKARMINFHGTSNLIQGTFGVIQRTFGVIQMMIDKPVWPTWAVGALFRGVGRIYINHALRMFLHTLVNYSIIFIIIHNLVQLIYYLLLSFFKFLDLFIFNVRRLFISNSHFKSSPAS